MSLALVAGRGALPKLVAEAQEVKPLICTYEGLMPEGLQSDMTFRVETLGSFLVTLGEQGVTQVCFAGALERPNIDPSKIDKETLPLVPLFQKALGKGDDGALRVVLELFQQTGFEVLGAHEIAPDLLASGGVYGEHWPDAQMRTNAQTGAAHIADIGEKDIGQACVVAAGKVVVMEDRLGTNALIQRAIPRIKNNDAILFKGPKPQQTRLLDLPTIGPDTIEEAGRAGLKGVVIDAGDVLVLEKARCIELADEHQLVLWARTGEDA